MVRVKHLFIFNFKTLKGNLKLRIISTIVLSTIIYSFCLLTFQKSHENKILRKNYFANKFDKNNKSDILFIGNSRVECGVNTILISKKTGLSCYNFGIPLTSFNGDIYFDFVYDKLDTSISPVIVVGLSPSTIMYYPSPKSTNELMMAYLKKPKIEFLKEKYFYKYLSNFSSYSPIQLFYSMIDRDYWFSSRVYNDDGWKKSFDYPMNEFRTNELFKNMYQSLKVNNNQYDTLLSKIKQWSEQGIIVLGFNCPTGGNLEEYERELGEFDEIDISNKFNAAGGHWIFIPGRNNFKSYDGSHLHYDGANKLSNLLADSISSHIGKSF